MILRFLVLGLLAVWITGCATAQSTGRRGLLEERAPGRGYTMKQPSRPAAIEIAGLASGALGWPLAQVQVTSPFGKRGRDFHEGIDLKAPHGTEVLAAQDGTVLYVGSRIRGYGKMIVLRHARQLSTIYAHNSSLLVRIGQTVKRGQRIALSGKTGHVTGPHLHFEIRDGMAALNPMDLLPSRKLSAVTPPASVSPQPPKGLSHRPLHAQKVAAAGRTTRRAGATLVESER
jgi:lipoprotein NlpD